MVTLAIGHFGFNLAAFAMLLSNASVVKEVRSGSKLLYDLNMGVGHDKCKLLLLAASDPCMGLGVVSWTSSRLVKVSDDGAPTQLC